MSLQPLLCGRRHDAVVVATSGWRLPAAASLLRTVICTDVDGTLFDSSHSLPAENARVLKLAMAAGCRVVLATGKAPGAWLRKGTLEGMPNKKPRLKQNLGLK